MDPPIEPLTGDGHRHLIDPLLTFAQTLGNSVAFQEIAGDTGGWCDHAGQRIAVDTSQPINAQVRILVHEYADVVVMPMSGRNAGRLGLIAA